MYSQDIRQFKRAHLEDERLWRRVLHGVPEATAREWTSPELQPLGLAVAQYLTHVIPCSPGKQFSCLASQCLASLSPGATVQEAVDQVLQDAPHLLSWQVYTVRRATVAVWDPIRSPLGSFLVETMGTLCVGPAPSIEGERADPDALRFLLRSKLLQTVERGSTNFRQAYS